MESGLIYGGYYDTAKDYKTVKMREKTGSIANDAEFAAKLTEKRSVSPQDMSLEEYKAYFGEKMNRLYVHPSQKNRNEVIDIADAAYKRMQTDPEYEKKILDALAKNWAVDFGGNIPQISYTHIDDTWEKCYGYTQGMKENYGYTGGSSAMHVNGKQKSISEKTGGAGQVSEAEEMALFKKEFYDDLARITTHRTVGNAAVNISEAAFKAMKDDPQYREKVLSLIQRDWGASYAPRDCSVLITVGATLDDYRGDSWSADCDSEFYMRSHGSFYKRTSEKKGRQIGQRPADEGKGATEKSAAEKQDLSLWAGDMVVPQPPSYRGFVYDSSISDKSKEEMTMDEYKQWFMHEMSKMPVSAWVRSTIVGGSLTITEACFERMKNDSEWEKRVLGTIRTMHSVHGIMGTKAIGYQVMGATPEQCCGAGIPVKNEASVSADNEKSWWEKRRKKMQELMEEQEKEALKKAMAGNAMIRQNYFQSLAESRQRLQTFFAGSVQDGQIGSDVTALPPVTVIATAATVYEQNISTFSRYAVGSRKI